MPNPVDNDPFDDGKVLSGKELISSKIEDAKRAFDRIVIQKTRDLKKWREDKMHSIFAASHDPYTGKRRRVLEFIPMHYPLHIADAENHMKTWKYLKPETDAQRSAIQNLSQSQREELNEQEGDFLDFMKPNLPFCEKVTHEYQDDMRTYFTKTDLPSHYHENRVFHEDAHSDCHQYRIILRGILSCSKEVQQTYFSEEELRLLRIALENEERRLSAFDNDRRDWIRTLEKKMEEREKESHDDSMLKLEEEIEKQ